MQLGLILPFWSCCVRLLAVYPELIDTVANVNNIFKSVGASLGFARVAKQVEQGELQRNELCQLGKVDRVLLDLQKVVIKVENNAIAEIAPVTLLVVFSDLCCCHHHSPQQASQSILGPLIGLLVADNVVA
jgi:hypothetical protein